MKFNYQVQRNKFKLLPKSTEGSMAQQEFERRPLPVVFVKLDCDKVDTGIFPDNIVVIVPQKLEISRSKEETIYRYINS